MSEQKIFVSHISEEAELAKALKSHLANAFGKSVDIFVSSDGESIKAGGRWLDELEKALKCAQIEIVLCSPESVKKQWVNFEAGAGWIRGIKIIPVCHSGMKPDQLPLPLNMLESLEASQVEGLRRLYYSIATQLNIATPEADFEAIAVAIAQVEEQYSHGQHVLPRIDNPRILCAASAHYSQPEFGFDLDAEVLEKAFPKKVIVERKLTSKRLRDMLSAEKFDIIHLVLEVDAASGDLLFSSIDQESGGSEAERAGRMSAEGLARLITEAKTSLIFLATCHALSLAVELAPVVNIIATHKNPRGNECAEWADWFYCFLSKGHSLEKAFALTKPNSEFPFRLIRHKDIIFRVNPD
jgi:hypothetical protein